MLFRPVRQGTLLLLKVLLFILFNHMISIGYSNFKTKEIGHADR